MEDSKRKGNAGLLYDTDEKVDPNPGIPAGSAGGGLVEPGKTDIGSAPLGTGGTHEDRSATNGGVGGPRAMNYEDEEDGK